MAADGWALMGSDAIRIHRRRLAFLVGLGQSAEGTAYQRLGRVTRAGVSPKVESATTTKELLEDSSLDRLEIHLSPLS
jgi:hypothetical protein